MCNKLSKNEQNDKHKTHYVLVLKYKE